MTSIAGTLAVVVVVLAATSVALLWVLMRRTRAVRALRNSEDKFRVTELVRYAFDRRLYVE